jgi:type IV pilus assembly protein PilA
MPAGVPVIKPKFSGHAIAAFYLSLTGLIAPETILYFAQTNQFIATYMDGLNGHDYGLLLTLLFSVSLGLLVISIRAGRRALKQIKEGGDELKGKGRAWTGIVVGYVGSSLYGFILVMGSPLSPFAPHIDRSPLAANQASAVGSLRAIRTAAEVYGSTYQRGYPRHLLALGPPPTGSPQNAQGSGLIDKTLASGAKSGYVFIYRVTAQDQNHRPSAYTVTATPNVGCGKVGNCYFMDETGIIRVETSRVPDKNSPQLAG